MNFRIKKYDKGFVVEVQKAGWFRMHWDSFINWSGSDDPFHFNKYEGAEGALLNEVKWKTIQNSK